MKRVAVYTLTVLLTLTALAVLWQLRTVVVMFLLSIATAAAFRPFIAFLESRKLPRGLALLVGYGLVIGLLAGLAFLMGRPLLEDLQDLTNQAMIGYDLIKTTWPNGSQLQQAVAAQLPTTQALMASLAGDGSTRSIQNLIGVTGSIFGIAGNLALILILSLYWSSDFLRFERMALALLPVEARPQARETYRAIETAMGAYIRSEVIQSLLAGLMLWAGYQLIGLPYAVLLAVFGALAWLIPWFGALIALVPAAGVAWEAGGLPLAALVSVFTLLVFFIQERVIEPRFFRRATYSSMILVILILVLAEEFGLIGLVVAPLVSAAIQITLQYLAQPPVVSGAQSEPVQASETRQDIDALWEKVAAAEEQMQAAGIDEIPGLVNLAERLKKLIGETQGYFDAQEGTGQPVPAGSRRLPGSVGPRRPDTPNRG